MTAQEHDHRPLLLLLRSLELGGAERQAVELAAALQASGRAVIVAVFARGGPLEGPLVERGVPLVEIGRGRWGAPGFLVRSALVARRIRPRAVIAYLDGPNLLSLLMKAAARPARAIWGVRIAGLDYAREPRNARIARRLESLLARFADAVISNSRPGVDEVVARGFPPTRTHFVPNGVDVSRFAPDERAGTQLRAAFGIPADGLVIAKVARLHPMKAWEVFVDAAAELCRERDDVWFLAVGGGPDAYAQELAARAEAVGLRRIVWAGPRTDVTAVYSAADVVTSASTSEGFPNVLAEAMACGVPCVATDVGESALVLGDLGEVVAPHSSTALADGWRRLLRRVAGMDHGRLRERVGDEFGIERLVERTLAIVDGP